MTQRREGLFSLHCILSIISPETYLVLALTPPGQWSRDLSWQADHGFKVGDSPKLLVTQSRIEFPLTLLIAARF